MVAVRWVVWPSSVGLSLAADNPLRGTSVIVTSVVSVTVLTELVAVTVAV